MAGLLHNLDDTVEIHAVMAVGEGGIQVRVQCTGCGVSVTLDTGNLYQTAYRVACKAKMVFKTHFRRVFYLSRCAAEQLGGRCSSHRACNSDFPLTTDFGS